MNLFSDVIEERRLRTCDSNFCEYTNLCLKTPTAISMPQPPLGLYEIAIPFLCWLTLVT